MTSIHTYDPATAGTALPDLPPLPIGALAVGAANLLQRRPSCPAPLRRALRPRVDQHAVRPADQPSMQAVTCWARRFGGIVTTEPVRASTGPETWCSTEFSYYGVSVTAYARIPAAPATT